MKPEPITRGHTSSATLDLLLLGGLDEKAETEVRAHLGSCERCKATLDEMEADRAHFNQFVLPRTLDAVEQRVMKPSWLEQLRARWVWGLAVVAAAGAVVLFYAPGQGEQPGYIGMKGGQAPRFEVYGRRGHGAVFAVNSQTRLHATDQIRFVVEPGEYTHVMVVSIDGRGVFNVYYPFDGTEAAPITGNRVELPGSIELDDAPGPERLVAVFAKRPITAAEVKAAWPVDAPLPNLSETEVRGFAYVKD